MDGLDGSPPYHVVEIVGDNGGREMEAAAERLQDMLQCRRIWVAREEVARGSGSGSTAAAAAAPSGTDAGEPAPLLSPLGLGIEVEKKGVFVEQAPRAAASAAAEEGGWVESPWGIPHLAETLLDGEDALLPLFLTDMEVVRGIVHDGSCRSASRTRLEILERKHSMYRILNQDLERDVEAAAAPAAKVHFLDHTRPEFVRADAAADELDNSTNFAFPPVVKLDAFAAVGAPRVGAPPAAAAAAAAEAAAAGSKHPVVLCVSKAGREHLTVRQFMQQLLLPFWQRYDRLRPCGGGGGGNDDAEDSVACVWSRVVGVCFEGAETDEVPSLLAPAVQGATGETRVEDVPDCLFLFLLWRAVAAVNEHRCRAAGFPLISLTMQVEQRDHLVAAYLLCKGVYNAAPLIKQQVLQYMYYLARVTVVSAPLSEGRSLAIGVLAHPFKRFLTVGLRVSLESSMVHAQRGERRAAAQQQQRTSPTDAGGYEEPLLPPEQEGTDEGFFAYDYSGPERRRQPHRQRHVPLREEVVATANILHLTKTDVVELARNSFELFHRTLQGGHTATAGAGGGGSGAAEYLRIRSLFRGRAYSAEHRVLAMAAARVAARRGGLVKASTAGAAAAKITEMCTARGVEMNVEEYIDHGRLEINGPKMLKKNAMSHAAEQIGEVLALRKKYRDEARHCSRDMLAVIEEGCAQKEAAAVNVDYPAGITLAEFVRDYSAVCAAMQSSGVKALSKRRLGMLSNKFATHASLRQLDELGNDSVGRKVSKMTDHRDFYQATIVDTHVHMAAGMTARDLLDFIKKKAAHQSDDIVGVEEAASASSCDASDPKERVVTLSDLLKKLGVRDPNGLTVASLGVQADSTLFERFDNFNSKYSPMGKTDLRTLFLKSNSNLPSFKGDIMGGRYFAEIIKTTFNRMAPNHYAEFRLSIYGRSRTEWAELARWHATHGMGSKKNKWLLQIPRIYSVLKRNGDVESFGDLLSNVFQPLWDASMYPGRHPQVDHFLKNASGFDSVDSEHGVDAAIDANTPVPTQWTSKENPPYAYWMYYLWANVSALNRFRRSRGLSTLSFRPHCGECGDPRHLASAFLAADGISHGIQLRLSPPLQYLYYLAQIGIAVSPLSNNSLFLELEHSPFPDFFKRGLSVSLSTDDPLFFHQTQEPIVEEYSVASKLWRLSSTDLCEIARNSTQHSGFDEDVKREWGGPLHFLASSIGNDERRTHVPDLRVAFRFEVYHDECYFLSRVRTVEGAPAPAPIPRFMPTLDEEDQVLQRLGEKRSDLLQKKRAGHDVAAAKAKL